MGLALDLQQGDPTGGAPARLPRCGEAPDLLTARVPEYRAQSATREGMHRLIVSVMLGTSPFTAELQAIAAKSERMKARPQVQERRRSTPALRRRNKREGQRHVHA